MWRLAAISIAILAMVGAASAQDRTESKTGAELYFISPGDGETVSGKVSVRFGLRGMGVAPAGIDKAGTGHHHLIIDAPLQPMDEPVLKDAHHRHFGGGQTEVDIELAPGPHTLQLVLGDHNHVPHSPPVVSERITVTVE